MAAEERLDPGVGIGIRVGVEADSGATAAARLVAVLHFVEEDPRLPLHVEVVDGARVARVAAASPWRFTRSRARPTSKSWATTSARVRRPLSGATSMTLAPITT